MFGLGISECFLILCIAVLIFGPKFFVNQFQSVRESFSGFNQGLKSSIKEDAEALPEGRQEKENS